MASENDTRESRQAAHPFAPQALIDAFPYKTHPWNAKRFVSELETRNKGALDWLNSMGWGDMPDAFLARGGSRTVRMTNSPIINHHLQMTSQEVAVHLLWQRTRTLYEIHPGLTRHLRSSDSDKFPPMILANLPHTNPLVFLAEPVELRDPANKPTRMVGWYVAGMTGRKDYVDTSDDTAQAFHITVVSEVMSDDGRTVIDWDHSRITLPITGEDATVGEIIETALSGFIFDPMIPGQTDNLQRVFISEILRVVVPHMLYLVSQELESKPSEFRTPPMPRQNKWDRKQGGGKVYAAQIGFRSGPVLQTLERWGDDSVEPQGPRGPGGVRKRPMAHVRRAHFHKYRTGAGRTETVVKWLAPIPINADGSIATETVAVKIK